MSVFAIQSGAAATDQPDGVRMMLKVQIPPDGGNLAIKARNQGEIFEALIDRMNPEAVYFTQEDGLRTAYFVYTIHQTTDFAAIHDEDDASDATRRRKAAH